MGRLVHDLGFVDPVKAAKNMREAEKAGRGSFGWAWVLDERPDERARGVTIDISLKSFETPRCALVPPYQQRMQAHACTHMASCTQVSTHHINTAKTTSLMRSDNLKSFELLSAGVRMAVKAQHGLQVCGDAAGCAGPQGLYSQHDHRRSASGRGNARSRRVARRLRVWLRQRCVPWPRRQCAATHSRPPALAMT